MESVVNEKCKCKLKQKEWMNENNQWEEHKDEANTATASDQW